MAQQMQTSSDRPFVPNSHRAADAAVGASRAAVEFVAPRSMVQLVRYCSVDEASLSAALRQAVDILDGFAAARGLPPVEDLIVVYRNRQRDTVTMEIGAPVEADIAETAEGELHAAIAPHGSFITRQVDAGLPNLLAGETELAEIAAAMGASAQPYFWQTFPAAHFRPWQGHPAAKVYLAVPPPAAA